MASKMSRSTVLYQKLRSNGTLSFPVTEQRFEEHQAKWPEAVFNEDAYFKYLQPLVEQNTTSYLTMLQGSKAEQRKWWLYNRFRYLDSKYNAGDALTDVVTLRGYAKDDITVTPYADIYATVKYGSYLVQQRANRNVAYTLACPLSNVNDTEIYIYSASQLQSIGDLSGLMVGYADFSMATRLQSLKVGDAADSYSNGNLTELYLGNNTLLRTLDVRNCPNLKQAVDVSGCTNIEHLYFEGTAVTGVQLPNGGILKTLHLPDTVTNLTIRNQTGITDFVIGGYDNISTLRLENVSEVFDLWEILHSIPAGARVRVTGLRRSFEDAADILAFYDLLDTMRGLDENGNNMDKAQISGAFTVAELTNDELAEMRERYPNIRIQYEHTHSNVYFYDDSGNTLLKTVTVYDGRDATYSGSNPTKTSTAQYSYRFSGWSLTAGGAANANALKTVVSDRNVYAAFTSTVQKYTVRFYNGTTLVQTVSDVPYGSNASYTGDTPTKTGVGKPEDYEFTGWNPSPNGITGNTDCYAQYRFIGFISVGIVERSISGDYSNDRVATVGAYAFQNCGGLTSVSFPNATAIGDYAFNAAHNLVKADLPKVTSIGQHGFSAANALETLILRDTETVCTLGADGLYYTKIHSGQGYIYVPAALVDSYKETACWKYEVDQIRAIEDYPEITGGGES